MAGHVDPLVALVPLVQRAIEAAVGPEHALTDPQVRRSDRADLQADVAMGLARKLKKPPRQVAEAIAAAMPENDLVARVEVAGPGFLNFTLRPEWLAAAATRVAQSDRLAVELAGAPDTVVVDYSHPNVAKEMHVGHLRSTVIGDTLVRVLAFRGHVIHRQNHIGDWGTPFGMLIEHLLDLGDERAKAELEVGELAMFYKAARAKFDEDHAFADRSRKRVVLLQGGDEPTLARWRVLVDLSTRYFEAVYEKLGVTLERKDIAGESFYNDRLAPLAKELEAIGRAKISDGALCLFPEGFKNKEGAPLPLIVQKSDGGFGYAATDLAAIRYRLAELHATRILYVVGAPQAQHLGMIITAAKALGWLVAPKRAEHVVFGSVLGTDKRMFKSRSGETVRLIDLIDAAIERAEAKIVEKNPELSADKRAEVAMMVGVGAIKYADLSSDRVKDYVFDLDRMVSFDGNTAGYAQYAYARAQSIARKAAAGGADKAEPLGAIAITEPAERALVLELLGFGAAVRAVEESLEPHRLASYVYSLASAFTAFYDACPIIRPEPPPDVRASRLALAALTARTIAKALDLLGIAVPDEM